MNPDKQKLQSLKIATRSSPLALIQANYVKKNLQRQGISSQLCQIKTTGDKILDKPLHEIGGKGVFIKELEKSLLRHETDLAVHSLKDLACVLEPEFKFLAYLPRSFFHDVLVVSKKHQFLLKSLQGKKVLSREDFCQIPPCVIGTGSLRRKALVQSCHKGLSVAPIRGNINTRLAKLESGDFDALILSEASLKRLEIAQEEFFSFRLDPLWFVPCTAQGVIVVESLIGFSQSLTAFTKMSCADTQKCCELERATMASLGGSCLLPIGIYFVLQSDRFLVNIVVLSEDGSKELRYSKDFSLDTDPLSLVAEIKEDLYNKGVNNILVDLGVEKISI